MFTTRSFLEIQSNADLTLNIATVKQLVQQINDAYNNIEYKLQIDAEIAQAAIHTCLRNLCGKDATLADDKLLNDCDIFESKLLNLDIRKQTIEHTLTEKYPCFEEIFSQYKITLHDQHTNLLEAIDDIYCRDSFIMYIINNIHSTIKDNLILARKALDLDCPHKIQDKTVILFVAEILCKIIKSKFEISKKDLQDAKLYALEVQNILVFLAQDSCVHVVGWPNSKQLTKTFLKEAEQEVLIRQPNHTNKLKMKY